MNKPESNLPDGTVDDSRSGGLDASLREAAAKDSAIATMAQARGLDEMERIRRAMFAAGEAAYHWDVSSDRIAWSENTPAILGIEDPEVLSTGRSYADLLDSQNFASRFDAVMRSGGKDQGDGVAFSIEYMLQVNGPDGRMPVWIEDSGRWYGGADGRPREVFGTVRRIDARHERDEELLFRGYCDPLTGMMNRGRLADTLAETIKRATHNGTECAFLVAAIRNLSVVNDAYGFDVADEVIMSVGERLKRVVRSGDVIGRYSGGKFGIIMSGCTEHEIRLAAERFLNVARESVLDTERGPVWAMLSIGGALLPKYAGEANMAMACAEEALAEAKRLPSDSFIGYQPSAERISVRSINARCAAEIVSSLKEDRFVLAYQPIIHADTGAVAMHEALLRMRCEDNETVAAHHLIPIAEKLGLVRLIDCEVAQMAVEALSANPDLALTVNVSGVTATDPRWFRQLTAILSENSEILDRLMVEITETMALQDLNETISFTRSLRELGCKVAIDDFGAGYTSFKNLKELDIDMVKIDGSFCESLVGNQDNQYFVRSLIDLAKKFDLLTAAEWVQSEEDAELLRSWGVDYLQGNLYGEAVIDVPWAVARHATDEAVDEVLSPFDASLYQPPGDEEQTDPDSKNVADESEDDTLLIGNEDVTDPISEGATGQSACEPGKIAVATEHGAEVQSDDAPGQEANVVANEPAPFFARSSDVIEAAQPCDEDEMPFVALLPDSADATPDRESDNEPDFQPYSSGDDAVVAATVADGDTGDEELPDSPRGEVVEPEAKVEAIREGSSLLQSARSLLDESFGPKDRPDRATPSGPVHESQVA